MPTFKTLICLCLVASSLFAESKAEAALRLQLEAAQKATLAAQQTAAAERETRIKTEAALAQATKERAALAASLSKNSNATHQQIAVGQEKAQNAADQAAKEQTAVTNTILKKQEEQSNKTDTLTEAVKAKYGFYSSVSNNFSANLTAIGVLVTLLFGIYSRYASQKSAAKTAEKVNAIAETQQKSAVTVAKLVVVGKATHDLVNAKFGKVLALLASSARRVADYSGSTVDREAADKAELDRKQHDEQQARVNAGAAIEPPPEPK